MTVIGLCGGAGSGKTTVAKLFEKFGNAAVFDADQEVHNMYENNKKIISIVEKYFPDSVCEGRVSRQQLTKHFWEHGNKWHKLQSIVHEILLQKQKQFIMTSKRLGKRFVILDVPLLLEKGFWRSCDVILHVYVSPQVQLRRLKMRGMSEQYIRFLLSQQISIGKRQSFADFSINTCCCMRDVSCFVSDVIKRGVHHVRNSHQKCLYKTI